MSLFRRVLLGFLLVLMAEEVFAQTPAIVVAVKARSYRQVSPTVQEEIGGMFGVQVEFTTATAANTSVQLRASSGAVTAFSRVSGVEYELEREFARAVDLDAAFPDGTYTVLVGGSIMATVNIGSSVAPVLITNYSELQAAPPGTDIRWQSPPRAADNETWMYSVVVRDAGGQEIFSRPLGLLGGTQLSIFSLPYGIPLTGELFFGKLRTVYANGGATAVGSVSGVVVEFPLKRVHPLPVILEQPRSRVAMVGEPVEFSVRVSNSIDGRWKRNGVVLPGETRTWLALYGAQVDNAGIYTFEAENPGGITASEPAVLLLQPEMKISSFAGRGERGGADGPVASATFSDIRQMACDQTGSLYVIDGHAIRKISGGIVTTLAGSIEQFGFVDGPGGAARFNRPLGIAVDVAGTVYVADTINGLVRRISVTGEVGTLPLPSRPYRGVAVDAAGNLYVRVGGEVIRVAPAGATTTFYRGPDVVPDNDRPLPIAVDRSGNVFAAYSGTVVRVAPDGGTMTIGNGRDKTTLKTGGLVGDLDFYGDVAALCVDALGNVYASGNARTWMIAPSLAVAAVANFSQLGGMGVGPQGTLYFTRGGVGFSTVIEQGVITPHSTDPHVKIIAQPRMQAVATGDAAALRVDAVGPDLSYQWLRGGVVMADATRPTLVVRDVTEAADYSVVVGNGVGAMTSEPARVTPVAATNPGRLINLSLRAQAGSGPQTLIMGFALAGTGPMGSSRTLLVRGIGPGLSSFGVGGVLADPRLQLVDGSGRVLASNDDWGGDRAVADASAMVGAFPLAANAKDSALLVTIPARAHTAQVLNSSGTGGVALAEIYEAPQSTDQGDLRLVNVSSRTVVGPGNNAMTVGFVVGGQTPRTVLIRAVGPGLLRFGVRDALPNPTITLFSGQTKLAENDNYGGTVERGVFDAVGAFQIDPLDAALVVTLPAGAYTVQVHGLTSAWTNVVSGVALVEIYEVR